MRFEWRARLALTNSDRIGVASQRTAVLGAIVTAAIMLSACALCSCKHERASGANHGASARSNETTFAERRAQHRTRLVRHGPAPQAFDADSAPRGAERVHYQSDGLELLAWYAHPPQPGRVPALVYFHGGFAFDTSDFDLVGPFLDAGFAVMTPTFRGENGNPGEFELFYGEVDDARSAIKWIRSRPDVDPSHVYAFGHSAGGAIAALVSLYPDTGLRMTGDAGGLYTPDALAGMHPPYDATDPDEALLRAPASNADQFSVPHIGYYGTHDWWGARGAKAAADLAAGAHRPLTIEAIEGDHYSTLEPALQRFLVRIQSDAARP